MANDKRNPKAAAAAGILNKKSSSAGDIAKSSLEGAAQGASVGALGGPWGALWGGLIGGVLGGVGEAVAPEQTKKAKVIIDPALKLAKTVGGSNVPDDAEALGTPKDWVAKDAYRGSKLRTTSL